MPASFVKDPDARLDYKVSWQTWLGTDTIVTANTSAFQSSPLLTSGGTIRLDQTSVSASVSHIIWVSGGTLDREYTIVSKIDTAAGRKNDYSFIIRVEST